MRRVFLIGVLGLLGLGGLLSCGSEPVAQLALTGARVQAGLEARTVQTAAGPVDYLVGGEGAPVVLVHGIFARKEHWLKVSRRLTDGYRVYLLDLPGFGDNPPLPTGGYRLSNQVGNLEGVMDALGLKSAHIAANSMGGQIAGVLAERSPERVRSLAFIGSPLGVEGAEQTDFERRARAGEAPLVVRNRAEYERRLSVLFPAGEPNAPRALTEKWAAEEIANGPLNQRIWDEVATYDVTPLQFLAPRIAAPSLILWCREDEIFHPSGAAVLERVLPNAERRMLDGCGHLPMLDKPNQTGRLYRAFLDRV